MTGCRGIEEQLDQAEAKVALLESKLRSLERCVVMARREFRRGGDPVDARSWLFRVTVDEDKYPE